ncbi:hypothetical protein MCHIJ_10880 [Mycolicibacterium chitae]|uniref:hypothetical protein n=1 Tax=Mycolicibacterium chitae TaxID=1792 RepID=UPI000F82892D|nr:hypothetical protein [Mycolicibacterium chitae]MCV7107551.1 hypothetical protein [Mycolicibacterium chitae]BBZ01651.1 hypothetical protein MCHIJ_10880 [Mycolicibacterium chitae]
MRALSDRLRDGRDLRYTLTQFRYAAARRRLPELNRVANWALTIWCGVLLWGTFILALVSGLAVLTVIGIGVALLVGGIALNLAARPVLRRLTTVRMPLTAERLVTDVLEPWQKVYQQWPPGMIDEDQVPIPMPASPRYALVCPNRSVLACLAANGVPAAYDMALLEDPRQVPAGLPVLVLHNASLPGLALARDARQWFGPRARVLGIAPKMVMDNEGAIRLRERPTRRADRAFLAGEPVSEREVRWLAAGWWSPVAAMPPAALLRAVSRAVERIDAQWDPERAQARRVGFLSWPAA